MQVCATIGLCDAPQLSTPARKLLAQTMMQAQRAQQQSTAPLTQLQPAQHSSNNLEDSTQCQICEMAVNYVKVGALSLYSVPLQWPAFISARCMLSVGVT